MKYLKISEYSSSSIRISLAPFRKSGLSSIFTPPLDAKESVSGSSFENVFFFGLIKKRWEGSADSSSKEIGLCMIYLENLIKSLVYLLGTGGEIFSSLSFNFFSIASSIIFSSLSSRSGKPSLFFLLFILFKLEFKKL